jgi:hypothetical protein
MTIYYEFRSYFHVFTMLWHTVQSLNDDFFVSCPVQAFDLSAYLDTRSGLCGCTSSKWYVLRSTNTNCLEPAIYVEIEVLGLAGLVCMHFLIEVATVH